MPVINFCRGYCLGEPIHAGLVCLNLPVGSGRALQIAYFDAALVELRRVPDLVNSILEVDPGETSQDGPSVRIYAFPSA